jgi:hypothetical protein
VRERGDADRHFIERFRAPLGGDDDFIELGGVILRNLAIRDRHAKRRQ